MTIKIYYAYEYDIWGPEPVSILKKHFSGADKQNFDKQYRACPSVKSFYHNVYGIPAICDYHLNISDKDTISNTLTQKYFDNNVCVTNQKKRSIQYGNILFFTEEKTLMATGSYPPFLEKTIPHANYITGEMDIGRYPRRMQASIEFLHDTDWNIYKGDLLWYIKFHTKEKIKFIPFHATEEIINLFDYGPGLKYKTARDKYMKTLIPFYDDIKKAGIKKIMSKKIKQNLSGGYA